MYLSKIKYDILVTLLFVCTLLLLFFNGRCSVDQLVLAIGLFAAIIGIYAIYQSRKKQFQKNINWRI